MWGKAKSCVHVFAIQEKYCTGEVRAGVDPLRLSRRNCVTRTPLSPSSVYRRLIFLTFGHMWETEGGRVQGTLLISFAETPLAAFVVDQNVEGGGVCVSHIHIPARFLAVFSRSPSPPFRLSLLTLSEIRLTLREIEVCRNVQ